MATNLEGFLHVTQLAIRQMLAQKTGGSIVTVTASLTSTAAPTSASGEGFATRGDAPSRPTDRLRRRPRIS